MNVDLVLNELSYQNPAANIFDAREWISNLRTTIQSASDLGIKKTLRMDENFYHTPLAKEYTFFNWLNDTNVDKQERLYFYTITTKVPFIDDLKNLDILEKTDLSDFYYGNKIAIGFKIAFWLESLSISFLSAVEWDTDLIDNIVAYMMNKNNTDLKEVQISIRHASRTIHLKRHENWIETRLMDSIEDGIDIWFRREELYPSLIFCNSVRRQLKGFHSSDPKFKHLKKSLSKFDTYCRNWQKGSFESKHLDLKSRPDREATLNKYKAERTFLCPDGIERVFSWHVDLNPGAWRIHFFPLEVEKKIIIGYIGEHLPIVSEN